MTLLQATATRPDAPAPGAPPRSLGVAVGVLEALAGRRPLHQIRARMTRTAFESLVDLLDTGRVIRMATGRITAQMPTESAVEATTSIAVGGRWLACVLRLDKGPDGWVCSDFAVVGLPR